MYPHEIPINYWVNHHPPVIKHGLPTMVDYTGYQLIIGLYQWDFQDPKLEVPTIYKAYVRPM